MKFAPLHIVSSYYFLHSGLTTDKIIRSIKKNDYFGAAIADLNVMYGIPEFIEGMERISKPYVTGAEFFVEGEYISCFAINEDGYKNLCILTSFAQNGDITLSDLGKFSNGLVGIINTNDGKIKTEIINQNEEESNLTHRLNSIAKNFNEFYLGIDISSRSEADYAKLVRKFAIDFSYECIAFPKICYENKDDAIVLTIVNTIDQDLKTDIKEQSGNQCFLSEIDYNKIYNQKELSNTIKIIKESSFNFHQKRGEMLHYPVKDSIEYLKDQIKSGLGAKGLSFKNEYLDRVKKELDVIIKMGYADYFLIVSDYVRYAREKGILVGPGRGSAAGCLIAYLLDITEIDPLQYDLLFERFLNEGRKTMPDIDIDFMDVRRDELFDYMREKYGKENVANIVTFQTIGAKQALRDIGRIYEYHTWLIDNLSKAITNPKLSLREAYKTLPAFKNYVDSDPYYLEIVTLASKIEGLPRQSGLHPAGLVVNNTPLQESIPISYDISDNAICQYEMNYLEEQGFLKMDFLSLRNLTIINNCIALIKLYENIEIDPYNIPYDQKETYDLISSGKLMGLFQLDGSEIKRAIKALQPKCFDDIVVALSLGRPGPMESIPTYIDRKNGKKQATYLSDEIKKILSPTYGVLVYQEQIVNIATAMAGFSLSEADLFRRGVSKKDRATLVAMHDKFVEGCLNHTYSKVQAEEMYQSIVKFANYGFNKSHAVGYAIIACRMAYLKAHYPLEFYASILQSSASTSDSKFSEYVSEMKSLGINMSLPNINISEKYFSIHDGNLIYPLNEIRGVNSIHINNILLEREANGEFKDFYQFVKRTFQFSLGEKVIEALINAGCFDSLCSSRASLRASINKALTYAELNHSENGQLSLSDDLIKAPPLSLANDDPLDNLDLEYDAIGIMLSDNPLAYKKDAILAKGALNISEIINERNKCSFAGIIKTKKIINTKKGVPMAFVKLFDNTGEIEITIFSDVFSRVLPLIEKNNIVIVTGQNKSNKGEIDFITDNIELLGD